MKAFQIEKDAIVRIIAGLIADELGWRFKRYTDFLTLAGWTGATALGDGGLGLSGEERAAVAERVARFFGVSAGAFEASDARSIEDWAQSAAASVRRRLVEISFTPAGRDSRTQSCAHRAEDVYKDAAAAANLLHGRRRLISLVSPHSYLGFAVTVLAPNLQHIPALDARGLAPDDLASLLAFGDVVVATPTIWRYAIGEGVRAPDNAIGVVFGEAMPPELASEMRKSGFGALRELYGSTETGLVGWRDSPTDGFVLFDHWRRDGDAIARLGASGAEYRAQPMDELQWSGERIFRLGPRRDGAVQIGAVNVFPERIARIINAHPAVADCRVVASRRAGGANRLVARIRLDREHPPTERVARDIDAWCRSQLRPDERPRIYNFETDLDGD